MIQKDILNRLDLCGEELINYNFDTKEYLTLREVLDVAIEETVIATMTFVRTHRHASTFTCKAVIEALKGA